jgi:hypothetical protein
MILFKKFGSLGRLGNCLWQYLFIRSLSHIHRVGWALPYWGYAKYFKFGKKWKEDIGYPVAYTICEPDFDYHPEIFEGIEWNDNNNFQGYFQSLKYSAWDDIKEDFRWDEKFLSSILERTDFRPGNKDWALHVRRGDFVNNKSHHQLSSSYYISFIKEHTDCQFYVFSDDIPTCRLWFSALPNVEYVDKSTDVEDMALMSQFKNLLLSNSTFAFWAALISELYQGTVVIRPNCLFSGALAKSCKGTDFWPERWAVREVIPVIVPPLDNRIDFKDITFITVVKIDSEDRRENLHLMLEFLLKHYDTNIIIGENFTQECEWVASLPGVSYVYFEDLEFHRTKFLNALFRLSKTEIVVNHDVDILIPPPQMEEAVHLIRGDWEFVYPFGGDFLRIPRTFYPEIKSSLNTKCLEGKEIKGKGDNSVGGCVLAKKSAHFRVGGENEKYRKFGREDVSRYNRYTKLGKCSEVKGPLYHIEHFIGPDSNPNHDYMAINLSEARKELDMNKEQLLNYIKTW